MKHIQTNKAVFGGGCFWCTDAVFRKLRGIASVEVGFAGGRAKNPTYDQVIVNNTGHIEVVNIEYNPNEISYNDLLTIFFRNTRPNKR